MELFSSYKRKRKNSIIKRIMDNKTRLFVLFAMLATFFSLALYAVARPVSNAFFIGAYGSDFFPFAWMGTVPLSYFVTYLYNKFLPKIGCLKFTIYFLVFLVFFDLFSIYAMEKIRFIPFIYYLWKEIYVMLLLQQIWSVIHSTIKMKNAKFLYGLIFAVGGLGGAFGSFLAKQGAVVHGSANLLFLSVPACILIVVSYFMMTRYSNAVFDSMRDSKVGSMLDGFKLIGRSSTLTGVLIMLVLMQISAALLDFEFQYYLQKHISTTDLRTSYAAKVYGMINTISVVLQTGGTFLLLHFLGLRKSHLALPLFLGAGALFGSIAPSFQKATQCFIAVKSIDFSLFGIIKEMLYVPLGSEEKFHAKAVIDVFAYRASKALASFLIFAMRSVGDVIFLINWSLVLIFICWFFSAFFLVQKDKKTDPISTTT